MFSISVLRLRLAILSLLPSFFLVCSPLWYALRWFLVVFTATFPLPLPVVALPYTACSHVPPLPSTAVLGWRRLMFPLFSWSCFLPWRFPGCTATPGPAAFSLSLPPPDPGTSVGAFPSAARGAVALLVLFCRHSPWSRPCRSDWAMVLFLFIVRGNFLVVFARLQRVFPSFTFSPTSGLRMGRRRRRG